MICENHKKRGRVIIEIPYHFVIQSVAKDLGNTYFMYSRFFGRSPQQPVFASL